MKTLICWLLTTTVASANCIAYQCPGPHPNYGNHIFESMVNTMVYNALRPRYQPPPPSPPVVYTAPRAPLDRDTWRKQILTEAARFCDQFPDDQACVPKQGEK